MGTEMRLRSESRLPPLLSMIAGMVDLIVFLTLGNLFTDHITGNLVVIAALVVRSKVSSTRRRASIGSISAVHARWSGSKCRIVAELRGWRAPPGGHARPRGPKGGLG